MWQIIIIFIVGLSLSIFGSRLLFEKGYVEKWMKGPWKNDLIKGRNDYYDYKYVKGVGSLLTGLLALGLAIYIFIKIYLFQ